MMMTKKIVQVRTTIHQDHLTKVNQVSVSLTRKMPPTHERSVTTPQVLMTTMITPLRIPRKLEEVTKLNKTRLTPSHAYLRKETEKKTPGLLINIPSARTWHVRTL